MAVRQRRAAKVDANQGQIVEFLRKAGAHVQVVGQPYDLAVFCRQCGDMAYFEVKDGSKTRKELTPAQLKTAVEMKAACVLQNHFFVVASVEEAQEALRNFRANALAKPHRMAQD